ncbi:hypothetical protein ADK67_27810 [Saccharothrix sp. NRRL B-16348]|nr:hypothetical protein ADK67_27810 [Saccharothrix sp. NRRL B-16348]
MQEDWIVTAVRRWAPPTPGSHQVTVIGVHHVGTEQYYERVKAVANSDPDAVVLYEGLRPGSVGEDGPVKLTTQEYKAVAVEQESGPAAGYRQMAWLLGLKVGSSSLASEYTKPNWRNGDMHMLDVMRAIGTRNLGARSIQGSAFGNTAFDPHAQAAAHAARQVDGGADLERARKEAAELGDAIATGAAQAGEGLKAMSAATLASAVRHDPVWRLRAMDNARRALKWACPGEMPLLMRAVQSVTRLLTGGWRRKSRTAERINHLVVYDLRELQLMTRVMRLAQDTPVVVVFGAGHMEGIGSFLDRNGYRQQTDRVSWLQAFPVRVPTGRERKQVLAELATKIERERTEAAEKNTVADADTAAQAASRTVRPDDIGGASIGAAREAAENGPAHVEEPTKSDPVS